MPNKEVLNPYALNHKHISDLPSYTTRHTSPIAAENPTSNPVFSSTALPLDAHASAPSSVVALRASTPLACFIGLLLSMLTLLSLVCLFVNRRREKEKRAAEEETEGEKAQWPVEMLPKYEGFGGG